MQYGYFDLDSKEYVIDNPNTPAPWVNYLGSPQYGAMISNNAEGYSFVKSGAKGRITRFRFNSQMALPGRYIYIQDKNVNDFWSVSWQPVGKSVKRFKSICKHGTGYTHITSEYRKIQSEVTYYVPNDCLYEVWKCKVTNNDKKEKNLSLTGFIEFTNDFNYEQDQVNLQYSLFITRTAYNDNAIVCHMSENDNKDKTTNSNGMERFFALSGAEVSSFCGDLKEFIGEYRNYSNPKSIEKGKCNNKLNYNSNPCGALCTDIDIAPGETKEILFILGPGDNNKAQELIKKYENIETAEKEINQLKEYWHKKLDNFKVETPSAEFNNMINVWNAYQCFITFIWSRAASFVYCGLRNGYGYRDTVQDIQGIIHLDPEMALEKIRFMLSAQVDNGGGLPLVKFNHNAGHEDTPDDESYVTATGHPSYRADDALWLFPTIVKYIGETGNTEFLNEQIVFANGGKASVYEHLKRAIKFSLKRQGDHNMHAGLHADWNDCLRLGKNGESTFVAFQLYYAMDVIKDMAVGQGDKKYIKQIDKEQQKLKAALDSCWDEDRFIRGIREDNVIVGAKKDKEANMWLNPQSFSVISGFARNDDRGSKAMETVNKVLNTKYGVKLFDPPYVDHYFDGALMHIYNPDTKENGGIFSQSQGWAILAEAILGNGNRAFEYFKESSPAAMNSDAEIRVIEPYAHGQFVESKASPHEGRAHVHWLTGTASTVMVGCVEGILGMRPDSEGLHINPSIPSEWDDIKISRTFRGKKLNITINNPGHNQSGVKSIIFNGKEQKDDYIKASELTENNDIIVNM